MGDLLKVLNRSNYFKKIHRLYSKTGLHLEPLASSFGAIGAAASSGAPTFGSIGGQQSGSTFGSLSSQPTSFGGAAASTAGGFGGFGSSTPKANPSIFGGSSGGSSTS